MASFRPGQAVVCIRDEWIENGRKIPAWFPAPIKGRVYTIEGLFTHPDVAGPCLAFAVFPDCGFEAQYFRHVAKPRTSIAVFEGILHRADKREPVT